MSRMRNVLEYLEQSAERFPEKSAVTDGICTYTYKELLAYSRKIGSGIAAVSYTHLDVYKRQDPCG